MTSRTTLEWVDPGGNSGQSCDYCGNSMDVVSINHDPDWRWDSPEAQALVSEGMELDLLLRCGKCGHEFEGAIYHDDLREEEWPE